MVNEGAEEPPRDAIPGSHCLRPQAGATLRPQRRVVKDEPEAWPQLCGTQWFRGLRGPPHGCRHPGLRHERLPAVLFTRAPVRCLRG